MRQFKFTSIDVEGLETLDVISKANNFNNWMFNTIKPYCNGSILEIGSGIGNISKYFIANGYKLTVSDIRDNYIDYLKLNLNKVDTLKIDLVDPNFDLVYNHLFDKFDTIFALNVVEHIDDDKKAIANCKKLLKNKGVLIILVPAYQFLYNKFDFELQHYRRYNSKELKNIFKLNKFNNLTSQYFNFIGIFGWFISGFIQKNKTIPGNQMMLFNKLVPIFKFIDKIVLNKIGLSVIVIGEK
jgi:SAM-dependent methyltransferase